MIVHSMAHGQLHLDCPLQVTVAESPAKCVYITKFPGMPNEVKYREKATALLEDLMVGWTPCSLIQL